MQNAVFCRDRLQSPLISRSFGRLRLHDRRLPVARQILEAVGVERRLVDLAALEVPISDSGG